MCKLKGDINMLYSFQKLNKNLLIAFTGLILVIGAPQGWSSEINEPEFIMDIWRGNGNDGPKKAMIEDEILRVKYAFVENQIVPKIADNHKGILQKKLNMKESLDLSDQCFNSSKGVVGEVAAACFFIQNRWTPWGAKMRCSLGKCFSDKIEGFKRNFTSDFTYLDNGNTKDKGPDHGIDGLFYKNFGNETYLIINENKYRGKENDLEKNHFGRLKDDNKTRQSSSDWNKKRLKGLNFNNVSDVSAVKEGITYTLIRTATFLNEKGKFKLYAIDNEGESRNKFYLKCLNKTGFFEYSPYSYEFHDMVTVAILDYILKK